MVEKACTVRTWKFHISSVTSTNRATICSTTCDRLRTGFTALQRVAPLTLSTRERLQQRLQLRVLKLDGCSVYRKRRGLGGLKPILAGLSEVPEGNLRLYDLSFDKDSCGVGFVTDLSDKPNRKIVIDVLHPGRANVSKVY